MADPISSFLSNYDEQSDTIHIPHANCCCGNDACAYLKHNQSALDGLERDVSTAARLGKALLVRHETYIADSERERKQMTAQIEDLEMEKQALEKRNATMILENRDLLDQLEALNNCVADSDTHVTNLQTTLQSTQLELQRLSQLASRTEKLERDIADFEREQAELQTSYTAKEDSEKSGIRRWRSAERTLASLQDQIERIEQEAKEEKERHEEIVGRMERRHSVERELDSAAGRLKGAAALKNGGDGNNVVSLFVKDILQDNANLQMGIVELREMLNTSNEEIESLRQQMQLHQPAEDDHDSQKTPVRRERGDLREELTRANSSELHVHHHYHAPPSAPKTLRRPKKKRTGALTPGSFTPRSGSVTPGSPRSSFSYHTPTPSTTILQQTAASVPQPIPGGGNRWSTQSSGTYQSLLESSMPSSPQSTTNRTSSIFDRVFSDAGLDSSRPTTPDTEEPGSPVIAPVPAKRAPSSAYRTFSAPTVQRRGLSPMTSARPSLNAIISREELPKVDQHLPGQNAIPEENEAEWEAASHEDLSLASPQSDGPQTPFALDESIYARPRPPLRRATSHESLLSVSGKDIHTLKSRPSQLLGPYARSSGMTSQAAVTGTQVHAARPAAMSRPAAASQSLLSGVAADQRQSANKAGLGKKVGGWMFGRWGGAAPTDAPSPSLPSASGSAVAAATAPIAIGQKGHARPGSVSSASTGDPVKGSLDASMSTPRKPKLRTPGINQGGPIPGLGPEIRISRPPVMKSLDEEGLKSVLEDGK